jgi:hypothetical protein
MDIRQQRQQEGDHRAAASDQGQESRPVLPKADATPRERTSAIFTSPTDVSRVNMNRMMNIAVMQANAKA